MIEFSFSQETLLKHISDYFDPSLKHFPQKYLKLFLNDGDLIPIHVAYLCPLCITNIIIVLYEEKEVRATANFDLDHYPQKSIGGESTILVCKACNNRAGHNYEFALKDHLYLSSFSRDKDSHKVVVKSSIPNVGIFKSKLWKNENGEWEISLKPKADIKIKPLDEWIEYSKTNTDWTMQINIPSPQDIHINKGMIKTAYLYCFALWGYEFAFSKAGDLFRMILSDKMDYPISVLPLKLDKEATPNYDSIPTGVCYISKPEELKSLVVNIRVKDKVKGLESIHPVFIPNPTKTGIEDLNKIQKVMNDNITGDISITPLLSILKSTPAAYSQTWHDMQRI